MAFLTSGIYFVSLFLRNATALENGYFPFTYSSTSAGPFSCRLTVDLIFCKVICFFVVGDPYCFSSLICFYGSCWFPWTSTEAKSKPLKRFWSMFSRSSSLSTLLSEDLTSTSAISLCKGSISLRSPIYLELSPSAPIFNGL